MLSKLDEFQILMNMKITDFMPTEYGMDLFHYTSPVGLNSILFGDSSKVTMWASRYDCLNDFSEGGVVGPVFQEACMELKETGEIDEYLYNLFSKVAPARTILLHYFDGKKSESPGQNAIDIYAHFQKIRIRLQCGITIRKEVNTKDLT